MLLVNGETIKCVYDRTSPTANTSAARPSVPRDFCERYNVGRTTVHQEIKEGRLKARKAGRRTLIGNEDAQAWWLALPALNEALDEEAPLTASSRPKAARNTSAPFEDTAMAPRAEGEQDTPKTRQLGRRGVKPMGSA
jgi:excisionase family DNA binding protein